MVDVSTKVANRITFKQSFVDKFRRSIKEDRLEWHFRFRHTGYRLLLTYSFYVSAKRNIEEKSILLSVIGLYYSFFHLVAGLMCVDPYLKYEQLPKFPLDHYRAKRDGIEEFMQRKGIDPRKIKYLSHRKVEKYVGTLLKKRIVTYEFSDSFHKSQHLRSMVNYAPAYFGNLSLDRNMEALIKQMRDNIDDANRYIFALDDEFIWTLNRHQFFWAPHDLIESFIGDAIGDDFTDNYLNSSESEEVFKILFDAVPTARCTICGKENRSALEEKIGEVYVCSEECKEKYIKRIVRP